MRKVARARCHAVIMCSDHTEIMCSDHTEIMCSDHTEIMCNDHTEIMCLIRITDPLTPFSVHGCFRSQLCVVYMATVCSVHGR